MKHDMSEFQTAAAATRYRDIVGELRLPDPGAVGDHAVRYSTGKRLNWFSDPVDDAGGISDALRGRGTWLVPHLVGPEPDRTLRIHEKHRAAERVMWMSWHPLEVLTVFRDSKFFPGGRRVLVCGLGLGVFQQIVEKRYTEVVTLEVNEGLAPLWRQLAAPNWRLVIGNAFHVARMFRRGAFDAVYFDIWPNFPGHDYDVVHDLCNRLGRRVAARSRCWAEDLRGMNVANVGEVPTGAFAACKLPDYI